MTNILEYNLKTKLKIKNKIKNYIFKQMFNILIIVNHYTYKHVCYRYGFRVKNINNNEKFYDVNGKIVQKDVSWAEK